MKKSSNRPVEFSEVPAWTYAGSDKSVYTFFTAIALAGLEGQLVRLSAETQKALLGSVVFGKQLIRVNADSTVTISRKVAFGQDFESMKAHSQLVATAARAGKIVSPGKSGGKYFTGVTPSWECPSGANYAANL